MDLCVCFLAVLSPGAVLCQALRRQQRRFEVAGSGALTRGEHLAGKMVKSIMSFWGKTSCVRTCRQHVQIAVLTYSDEF